MPNSRSVHNFVKLELGKALRDTGGAPGPGHQPRTLSLPHPVTPTSEPAAPDWGAPYLAGRLGAGAVLSRGESECGRVAVAAAWTSSGSRRISIREAPGPLVVRVLPPSQGSNRFTEQLRRKPPFPTPILTRCRQPEDAVLSPVQGVPRRVSGGETKRPPSPESPKQMAKSSTLAPSEHSAGP